MLSVVAIVAVVVVIHFY